MIKTGKLTQVFVNDKDKTGKPLIGVKSGNPYRIVVIGLDTMKERLSGFVHDIEKDVRLGWKVGDEVTISVEKKGEYWNFELPKAEDLILVEIEEIKKRLDKLEGGKEEMADLPDFPDFQT